MAIEDAASLRFSKALFCGAGPTCGRFTHRAPLASRGGRRAFFRSPITPRLLIDYRSLRPLLDDYVALCQPHEVRLRDSAGDHAPADLRARLRPGELDAPLTGLASEGGNPTQITFRFPGGEHTYALIWHPERYGWTAPRGSRTVHFVAPRPWIKDPPYCGDAMLVSLCKRNFMQNDDPFWPMDDPKYCKTCTERYRDFLRERGLGG